MRVWAPLFRLRVTITYLVLAIVFLTDGEVNWLWLASVVALFAVAEWVSGSLIRYLHRSWRIAWAAGWTALVAVAAISDPTFTAFGHISALAIGFALGAFYIRADSIAKGANTFDAAITEPPQQDPAMTTLMTHEHR